MDDLEKKLFAQLDDEMPGVRANALEALREHLKKQGRTFRDLVADLEKAVPPAKVAELERIVAELESKIEELEEQLAEYDKANTAAQKRDAAQRREIATLKAALWVKANWKIIGGVAAALLVAVTGYWAYERYWSRSEAVNAGLRSAVASAEWGEGWGEPFARTIRGESWWLMLRGDIDASSYSDSHGNPVEMRCLHLYAAPAQPYSGGEYFKPSPRNFLGWVDWPEVAMQCTPSPDQRAENQ